MPRPWLPRAHPLLGKVSDHEIARRLGVARTVVSKARRKLGITSVRRVHPRGRPWLVMVRPMLGKLSDREIARRTGIHFKTIAEGRRSLGIAPAPRKATTVADRSWVPGIRHLLGKMPDREVGKLVGVSFRRVAAARRELGIAAYGKRPKVRGRGKVPLTDALLRSKQSAPEIARMTGVAVQTIYGRRKAMGIPKAKRTR